MTVLRTLPEALAAQLAGVSAATVAASMAAWAAGGTPPSWVLAGYTAARVHLDRAAPLERSEAPAVLIGPPDLELDPDAWDIDAERWAGEVDLELTLITRADAASVAADLLLPAVLARLAADLTLGGQALESRVAYLRQGTESADATLRTHALGVTARVLLNPATLEVAV